MGPTYQCNHNNNKRISNDKDIDGCCEEAEVPAGATRQEASASDEKNKRWER
jgi:hypothetical protein